MQPTLAAVVINRMLPHWFLAFLLLLSY